MRNSYKATELMEWHFLVKWRECCNYSGQKLSWKNMRGGLIATETVEELILLIMALS